MSADIVERLGVAEAKALDYGFSTDESELLSAARAEIVRLRGEVCSCPSGDGSLRWPCKAHPPGAIAPAEANGDDLGAVRDAITETVLKYANNNDIPPELFRDELFVAVSTALQHGGDSQEVSRG